MIKDRLKEFQAIVEDVFPNHANRMDSQNNMRGIDNVALDIQDSEYGYMEHFFNQIEQSRLKITQIKEHVVLMRTLHGKLLLLPRQDENIKRDVDLKTENVKKMGKQVSIVLKGLEKQINQEEDESTNDNEQASAALRIRKTQHATTVHMLVEALAEFNAEQIDYKEKCEERMQKIVSIAKAEISNDQFDELVSQGNYSAVFNGNIIAETLEARKTLQEVQDRHMELMKLEKSIQELRDMFVEMAMLVEKQGDIVNSIEQHVLRAGEAAENAKIETKKAVIYSSKARIKKIIVIMICVCVILCLLAWLYSIFFGHDNTSET
ncbi:Target SNARE coiled-coil homology domain,Syntaxin/epimorphin, conserved site,Syntaxin, N- [Cinara cedri]|uniref:Target SNARE coiled-coil homology domain,Syntaxin/epimorphin, conserved site,Syntaxin, N n=1 Tax=Cinara cedri TaxID=506608 RepID=A0A5E4NDA6_9HEMI|nr:Target SNARE coiled-coil homology domain,Syntaxin/epimorphin, conserved site,Syntaxin, N- [Cinara cedri]